MNKQQPAEPFLDRWSRRKLEAEQPETPEVPSQESSPVGPEPAAELTDADLPSPESLDEDADYAAFLAPGISADLRRRALQHLFALSRFNGGDGLDEYAEDFTRFPPLGDLVTREMRRMLELENDGSEQDRKEEAPGSPAPTESTEAAAAEDSDEPKPGNKVGEE
jgi:hypothetical protein